MIKYIHDKKRVGIFLSKRAQNQRNQSQANIKIEVSVKCFNKRRKCEKERRFSLEQQLMITEYKQSIKKQKIVVRVKKKQKKTKLLNIYI